MEFLLKAIRCCYTASSVETEYDLNSDFRKRDKDKEKEKEKEKSLLRKGYSSGFNSEVQTDCGKFKYIKIDSKNFNETVDHDALLIDEKFIREDEKRALKFVISLNIINLEYKWYS